MTEDEEYFSFEQEPVPTDLPPKTITFLIDPSLTRIWRRIGLKEPEVQNETTSLAICLTKAYLEFIARASSRCDDMNRDIHSKKKEFARLKKVFGDTTMKLDVNDDLPLKEQENITNREIENINKKYAPRVQVLKELHLKCKHHFDKLVVDDSDRGEFKELGDTDYTQERVERFKKMLMALKKEEANRVNIYRSCEKSIKEISKELQEPLSDQVVLIFANELVDTDSIQALTKAAEDLAKLKLERHKEYEQLIKSVQHYYSLLQVPPEDQVDIPPRPTRDAIELLRAEKDLRSHTVNERMADLIFQYQSEINDICDKMHVPEKLRPKYIGNNPTEQLDFLEASAKSMRYRLAKTQPIIALLTQIEEIKRTPSPRANKTGTPNISQQFLDKQTQEKIDIDLPPLEKKLLELLLEFRRENGFDFQFEGVTYIDTLSQAYMADDDDKFGKTVLDHKSPAPKNTPRKSPAPTSSPYRYTPKRSPYTPQKSPYTPRKNSGMSYL